MPRLRDNLKPGARIDSYRIVQSIGKGGFSLSMTLTLRIFLPLLDALALMHSRAMLHLDLKPGNIQLRTGHDPLLLDLGAVHLTDNNSSPGSQVVPAGYSPLEQYRRDSNIGPWTNVYAIGATLRCRLEGKPPLRSPERAGNDTQAPAIEALRAVSNVAAGTDRRVHGTQAPSPGRRARAQHPASAPG
jgi:serine/threonine protein kinase